MAEKRQFWPFSRNCKRRVLHHCARFKIKDTGKSVEKLKNARALEMANTFNFVKERVEEEITSTSHGPESTSLPSTVGIETDGNSARQIVQMYDKKSSFGSVDRKKHDIDRTGNVSRNSVENSALSVETTAEIELDSWGVKDPVLREMMKPNLIRQASQRQHHTIFEEVEPELRKIASRSSSDENPRKNSDEVQKSPDVSILSDERSEEIAPLPSSSNPERSTIATRKSFKDSFRAFAKMDKSVEEKISARVSSPVLSSLLKNTSKVSRPRTPKNDSTNSQLFSKSYEKRSKIQSSKNSENKIGSSKPKDTVPVWQVCPPAPDPENLGLKSSPKSVFSKPMIKDTTTDDQESSSDMQTSEFIDKIVTESSARFQKEVSEREEFSKSDSKTLDTFEKMMNRPYKSLSVPISGPVSDPTSRPESRPSSRLQEYIKKMNSEKLALSLSKTPEPLDSSKKTAIGVPLNKIFSSKIKGNQELFGDSDVQTSREDLLSQNMSKRKDEECSQNVILKSEVLSQSTVYKTEDRSKSKSVYKTSSSYNPNFSASVSNSKSGKQASQQKPIEDKVAEVQRFGNTTRKPRWKQTGQPLPLTQKNDLRKPKIDVVKSRKSSFSKSGKNRSTSSHSKSFSDSRSSRSSSKTYSGSYSKTGSGSYSETYSRTRSGYSKSSRSKRYSSGSYSQSGSYSKSSESYTDSQATTSKTAQEQVSAVI